MLTINIFDRKYAPKNENPNKIVENNNAINNTRSCNGTPFRMPYNHVRKVTNCSTCISNVKVSKDPIAAAVGDGTCFCYDPTIKNYLNKDGKAQYNFIFNHYNVMYKRSKVYEKNTPSNIHGLTDISNVYQSTPPDVNNNNVEPCSKLVYKYTNRSNKSNGATSQKSRIARLKYNNTTAMQSRFYSFTCKKAFGCLQTNEPRPVKLSNAVNCYPKTNGNKTVCD